MSLIDKEGFLRKANKPQLANALWKMCNGDLSYLPEGVEFHYVLDGGSLLHRIEWQKGSSFSHICQKYVNYIKNSFGSNVTVFFDGYGSEPSTKDMAHLRRTKGKIVKSVHIDLIKTLNMQKEDFY